MWPIYLCDDDPAILDALRKQLIRCAGSSISKIFTFQNPETLLFHLQDCKGSGGIVILDIELQDEQSGIKIADKIIREHPEMEIIFLSGFDKYYLDVYSVPHIYFLKKPVPETRLKEGIEFAASRLKNREKDFIAISSKGETFKINLNSILYVEVNKRILTIYTEEQSYSFYGKLDDFLMESNRSLLIKCHKSYAVNLAKVRGIHGKLFLLEENIEIPISQAHFKEAKERYCSYLERLL